MIVSDCRPLFPFSLGKKYLQEISFSFFGLSYLFGFITLAASSGKRNVTV